jgi:hypothetical protein
MSFQTLLASSAAGLSALYFIRGALLDLGIGAKPKASACGKCGGCPAARKG